MLWGDQDLVKLGTNEHEVEKKTLGWAVPFLEALNLLPLGTSGCLHPPADISCSIGQRGENTETEETGVHTTCLVSSKQGVNAGPSPHTGVMSQDQDWWLSRRNTGNFHSWGRKTAGRKDCFTPDEHRAHLSIRPVISPRFLMSQSNAPFVSHDSGVLSTGADTALWRTLHCPKSFSLRGFSLPARAVVISLCPRGPLLKFTGERRNFMMLTHQGDPSQASAAMAGLLGAKRYFMCLWWWFCESILNLSGCVWSFMWRWKEGASTKRSTVEPRGTSSTLRPCSDWSVGDQFSYTLPCPESFFALVPVVCIVSLRWGRVYSFLGRHRQK